MSQHGDHCLTLRSKIIEHKDNYKIVIDVFLDTISNQDWDDSSVIQMLKYGLGISNEIDEELYRHITIFQSYL